MKIILLAILLITLQAKTLTHLQTQYQTCCPDTYVLEPNELRCICPPERPYITTSNKCIACSSPSIWNDKESKCYTCPVNSWYEEGQGCLECPAPYIAIDK